MKILVLNASLTFAKKDSCQPLLMEKGDSLPGGLLSAYSAAKMYGVLGCSTVAF